MEQRNKRYDPKQVILVRTDIEIPAGKLATQVAHASLKCIFDAGKFTNNHFVVDFTEEQAFWFKESFAKICLGVNSIIELETIIEQAKKTGIWTSIIEDEGRTVFKSPTVTCAGIGPTTYELIQPITGHLKLYKGYISPQSL